MNYSIFALLLSTALFLQGGTFNIFQTAKNEPVKVEMATPTADITEKAEAAVESQLISPLRKRTVVKKSEMFSRCPSGYNYAFRNTDYLNNKQVLIAEDDGNFYGDVELYSGCRPHQVCEYRVNAKTFVVEARVLSTEEFVSAKQWLANTESKGESL